jgi:putative PIN family toxin of toxin-antitoxin system
VIVVFDSGIWVSALEFGGVPRLALEHADAEDQMILCADIEGEVVRIMSTKFGRTPDSVRSRMSELSRDAIWTVVHGRVAGICRDPKDDFILECAPDGHADFIVTGDKDLLSLGSYEATRIVTPRQYLELTIKR